MADDKFEKIAEHYAGTDIEAKKALVEWMRANIDEDDLDDWNPAPNRRSAEC